MYLSHGNSRTVIKGPSHIMGPKSTQSIAIVLHELA